jgi:hypothetical protein
LASCWFVLSAFGATQLLAQEVRYEQGADGVQYQVTTQVVREQVPVTQIQERQQTVYRQEVATNQYEHQTLVNVPVTQYRLVSRMKGRFNPFVTPYWTHEYEPVTTWHQQVATVKVPLRQLSWKPEVQTLRVPVTTYKTAEKTIVSRVAMNSPTPTGGARPLTSFAQAPLAPTGPSATIAARPAAASRVAAQAAGTPYGGVTMENDPPRQATGWQSPNDGRYR